MNTHINIPWRYQLSDAGVPDIVASSVLPLPTTQNGAREIRAVVEQNIGKQVREWNSVNQVADLINLSPTIALLTGKNVAQMHVF